MYAKAGLLAIALVCSGLLSGCATGGGPMDLLPATERVFLNAQARMGSSATAKPISVEEMLAQARGEAAASPAGVIETPPNIELQFAEREDGLQGRHLIALGEFRRDAESLSAPVEEIIISVPSGDWTTMAKAAAVGRLLNGVASKIAIRRDKALPVRRLRIAAEFGQGEGAA